MRLIDADALRIKMYDEAFETDTDEQRWDSGCWIRYRMFERNVDDAPTIESIPIDWLDAQIRGYASALKSTELKALMLVKQMWEREQEART